MNIDEKRQAIIDCVNSKRLSAFKIEPTRKGATIDRLKKGKPCKDTTIEKLYSRMISLLASKPVMEASTIEASKPVIEASIEASKPYITKDITSITIEQLQETIKNMQSQIECLQEQVKSLQADKPSITPSITSNNIMGFSISRDKKGRYIGVKRINGKLKSVYIGYDINLAIDKITEYLKRFE